MTKIAIIGKGTIGEHAIAVAHRYGYEIVFIASQAGVRRPDGGQLCAYGPHIANELASFCAASDVRRILIAIPSGGTGDIEADYINATADRGCKIVTAGKSALANRFDAIAPKISQLAFDATVGGGTMIPSFLEDTLHVSADFPFVITAVANGTINYAQSRVLQNATREQIINECEREGFCEPRRPGQEPDFRAMYVEEFNDISRKIAILCNTRLRSLVGRTVTQRDFAPSVFSEEDMLKVTAGNSDYRYLFRICVRPRDLEYFRDIAIGGSINVRLDEISVAAGFVPLAGALRSWVPNHVGNAVLVTQNGDSDLRIGQGAGPVPTVGAMYSNLRRFDRAA